MTKVMSLMQRVQAYGIISTRGYKMTQEQATKFKEYTLQYTEETAAIDAMMNNNTITRAEYRELLAKAYSDYAHALHEDCGVTK